MKKRTKEKLWQSTRGAISILLICLTLPFLSLAALYVEVGRYQSGLSALDQALGSSAVSTLANMDSYLLNRFGLMAVNQKTGDVDSELTATLRSYFGRQQITDLNAVSVADDKLTANGVYPLSDMSVLKQQVVEASSVMAPVKFLTEFGDINNLIKQIQKSFGFLKILDACSGCVDIAEKQVAALEALDDAKKQMKEVQKAQEAYDKAFDAWQDAVEKLADHLDTERPDGGAHPILAGLWDNTKKDRTKDAEQARNKYLSALSELISAFDQLRTDLNAAVQSQQSLDNQVVGTTFDIIGNGIEAKTQGEDEDPEVKAMGKTMKDVVSGTEKALKTEYSRMGDLLDTFSPEALQNAMTGLLQEQQRVSAYNTDDITGATARPPESDYHFVALDHLTDDKAIDEYMKASEEELEKTGLLDLLELLIDIYNAVFNIETIADGELNIRLDTGYYQSQIGGLPSRAKTTYENPYAERDEDNSVRYLAAIDPDFDAADPYGLIANTAEGKLQKAIDSFDRLKKDVKDIQEGNFIARIKALVKAVKEGFALIGHIFDLFVTIVKDIQRALYQKFLLASYLAFNLPNRTNYNTGVGLCGYKYANIARTPAAMGYTIPLVGDVAAMVSGGVTGYNFRGAELEYVMWGSDFEMYNQMMQFWALTLLRLLCDAGPIYTDEMWSSIINPLIPYFGAGYLVWALATAMEAFVDTTLLVNGGEVSLVKEHVYLSPAGLPDLIEDFTVVTLSEAKKKKLIKSAAEMTNTEYSASLEDKPKDKTEKPLIDWEKIGKNYQKGLMKFDYTEYSMLMLCLFTSEDKALLRFADLIQCEKTMGNHTNATLSQQMSGQYTQFDINQAYTVLRVSAQGSMVPMLPMLFKQQLINLHALELATVLYRGY